MILLIDNYDSFVHNLARYFRLLGQETLVVRHDQTDVAAIADLQPRAIVFSPGPCAPQQAGCCLEVVRALHPTIPMLGVCLGHQVIAEAFGGRIVRANQPVHGQASPIRHDQRGVFAKVPNPFPAARYHSLVVDPASVPSCLQITAWSDDRTIMAIEHRERPVVGWQFHPESVLTHVGYDLLAAFLRSVGIDEVRVPPGTELHFEQQSVDQDWFQQTIQR